MLTTVDDFIRRRIIKVRPTLARTLACSIAAVLVVAVMLYTSKGSLMGFISALFLLALVGAMWRRLYL